MLEGALFYHINHYCTDFIGIYQRIPFWCVLSRAWRSAQAPAKPTLRRFQPYWQRCQTCSTSASMWPTATPSISFTSSRTSERSFPPTPSWSVLLPGTAALAQLPCFLTVAFIFARREMWWRERWWRSWFWPGLTSSKSASDQVIVASSPQGKCRLFLWNTPHGSFCMCCHRLCVHHPQEDRGRVPPAQRRDRVCRCSPRLGRPHHLRESLFTHKSGVWSNN